MKFGASAAAAISLVACASIIPPGQAQDSGWTAGPPTATPAPGPVPENYRGSGTTIRIGDDPERAVGAGVAPGPSVDSLDIAPDKARAALGAFATSCGSLVRREDLSGLVQGADWQPSCDAARAWGNSDPIRFFIDYFESVEVNGGGAFATGYFEPEIAASRIRNENYRTPIYARPADLVEVDLGLFSDEWKGKRIRGKVADNKLVLYEDRAAIEDGALAGRGLELAWAADPIELFFLQIQGSGRLRMPDGSIMRIGYASQNGRDYTGIGRVMRERGLLVPGKANMQGIIEWLRANPAEGRALMRENESYVFFRELTGPGPLGAMGHPVVARASVATDPRFVPLGAPVLLDMEHDIADGLWVAQDTGGAIKGANRFDTFWGAGAQAREIAGGMSSNGKALILLPKGSFAKLAARAAN